MKNKIRGYLYQIVEMFPIEGGNGIRELTTHDRLEDATKVLEVLESVNYDFTCYAMMMRPVWEQEHISPCDHSGSTSIITTNGDYYFHCPKCGKRENLKEGL